MHKKWWIVYNLAYWIGISATIENTSDGAKTADFSRGDRSRLWQHWTAWAVSQVRSLRDHMCLDLCPWHARKQFYHFNVTQSKKHKKPRANRTPSDSFDSRVREALTRCKFKCKIHAPISGLRVREKRAVTDISINFQKTSFLRPVCCRSYFVNYFRHLN